MKKIVLLLTLFVTTPMATAGMLSHADLLRVTAGADFIPRKSPPINLKDDQSELGKLSKDIVNGMHTLVESIDYLDNGEAVAKVLFLDQRCVLTYVPAENQWHWKLTKIRCDGDDQMPTVQDDVPEEYVIPATPKGLGQQPDCETNCVGIYDGPRDPIPSKLSN